MSSGRIPDTAYEAGARQMIQDRLDRDRRDGAQRGAARGSIHDMDAPLQQDVLGHGGRGSASIGRVRVWTRRSTAARSRPATTNVTAMRFNSSRVKSPFSSGGRPVLQIDGTTLTLPAAGRDNSLTASLVRANGVWRLGTLPASDLRKRHRVTRPDRRRVHGRVRVRQADRQAAVGCTGKVGERSGRVRHQRVGHFFRSEPHVKTDREIVAADLAQYNIALFGDPSSNTIYKRIATRLPIAWRADGVVAGGQKFDASHLRSSYSPIRSIPGNTSSSTADSRFTIRRTTRCSRRSCPTGRSWTSRSRATTIGTCRCLSRRKVFSTNGGGSLYRRRSRASSRPPAARSPALRSRRRRRGRIAVARAPAVDVRPAPCR